MRQYAEKNAEKWFILSSKYHLVRPEDIIEPYDVTFNKTPAAEIKTWARETLEMLKNELSPIAYVAAVEHPEPLVLNICVTQIEQLRRRSCTLRF
jgi:hypothetical protein